MFRCLVASPLGELTAASDGVSLTGLWLPGQKYFAAGLGKDVQELPDLPVFLRTRDWLAAYFSGAPLPQMPPLAPGGSGFCREVWRQLSDIPYGETVTYGDISRQLCGRGIPASPRAVGGAVGRNPVAVLIPCHRVVGAGGRLTGYAGGLSAKEFLLTLEREHRQSCFCAGR